MKKLILFILCIVVFVITFFGLYKTTPNHVISIHREHSFIINKSFNNVRKDLYQRDLMEEIIESHGGKLLSKHFVTKNFRIENWKHPLKSWEYHAVVNASASLKYPNEDIEIYNKVWADPRRIYSESSLVRPLEIGITQWDQTIEIVPYGDQTHVTVKLDVKLERIVPNNWREYAWDKVNRAATKNTLDFEFILRNFLGCKN